MVIQLILKKFSNNFHALGSVWFIESELKASEIRDKLEDAIDDNDKIFVVEIKKHWGGININGIPSWLKN